MKAPRRLRLILLAALSGWPWPASAVEHVDLKLVLATDVSGSINNNELWLERQGTAAAFLYPDVIRAIETGALGRIAVAMVDFSSPGFGKTVIEWRIIHDRASAADFARTILNIPRTPGNRTSVSDALELGARLLESSDKEIVATRKVIDVAGDGANNDGKPLAEARRRVMARGIVVNGLAIMDENANGYFPDLDKYYRACVAGGRGAFVIAVKSFRDFGAAMRRKLILEISQNETGVRQADLGTTSLLRPIAVPAAQSPPLLRPPPNEHSKDCNVPDAPPGSRNGGTRS
jgi:Protein of unknown function (DUF1194)